MIWLIRSEGERIFLIGDEVEAIITVEQFSTIGGNQAVMIDVEIWKKDTPFNGRNGWYFNGSIMKVYELETKIHLSSLRHTSVKLIVDAPDHVRVLRGELL